MKQLMITEWFARAVTARLIPDCKVFPNWKNVYVRRCDENSIMFFNDVDCDESIILNSNNDIFVVDCQLRKDGKDLYSLEWRRPTENDIGKMCWFYSNRNHKDKTVYCAELFGFQNEFNVMGTKFIYHLAGEYARPEKYCLLADYNQITPNEQDFKRIYGA